MPGRLVGLVSRPNTLWRWC